MTVIRASIDRYGGELKDLTDDDWAAMRSVWELPEDREGYWASDEVVMDIDDVGSLPERVVPFIKLKPIKRLRFSPGVGDLQRAGAEVAREIVNNTYQVHLPGSDLMTIQEVEWMENACTEELQSMLNSGWRILAVCPQPGSRRPDYVLGKIPRPR